MGFEAALATLQRLEGATVDVSFYASTPNADLFLGSFGGILSEGRGPIGSFSGNSSAERWVFSANGDTHFSLDSGFFEGAEVLPVRQEPEAGPLECRYIYWTLVLRQAGTALYIAVDVDDPEHPDPAPPAPGAL